MFFYSFQFHLVFKRYELYLYCICFLFSLFIDWFCGNFVNDKSILLSSYSSSILIRFLSWFNNVIYCTGTTPFLHSKKIKLNTVPFILMGRWGYLQFREANKHNCLLIWFYRAWCCFYYITFCSISQGLDEIYNFNFWPH